jgi:hypothetical protein
MKDLDFFCDLACKFAQLPQEKGLDGSGSCRTFLALYCKRKKRVVAKNLPCNQKVLKSKPKGSTKRKEFA